MASNFPEPRSAAGDEVDSRGRKTWTRPPPHGRQDPVHLRLPQPWHRHARQLRRCLNLPGLLVRRSTAAGAPPTEGPPLFFCLQFRNQGMLCADARVDDTFDAISACAVSGRQARGAHRDHTPAAWASAPRGRRAGQRYALSITAEDPIAQPPVAGRIWNLALRHHPEKEQAPSCESSAPLGAPRSHHRCSRASPPHFVLKIMNLVCDDLGTLPPAFTTPPPEAPSQIIWTGRLTLGQPLQQHLHHGVSDFMIMLLDTHCGQLITN